MTSVVLSQTLCPSVIGLSVRMVHGCSSLPTSVCVVAQALGVALKLTFQGQNQLAYLQFYVFLGVSATAVV